MDFEKLKEIREFVDKQVEFSRLYSESRKEAGIAESELKILLTSELPSIRKEKKNAGIEMAILILLERNQIAKNLYETYVKKEAEYKGLERLIDSYQAKISFEQSVMKYLSIGEKFGC